MGDHRRRLRQTDVADATLADAAAERLYRKPNSDLLLQGQAPEANVDHAHHRDLPDVPAGGAEDHRKQVHDEPRIDPQSHHPDAAGLGQNV